MPGTHLDSGFHLPSRHLGGPYAPSDSGSDVDQYEKGVDGNAELTHQVLPDEPSVSHSDISPELSEISINVQRVLKLRHKYIGLSLQNPSDNPKDWDGWKIYPPPPRPTWGDNKTRPVAGESEPEKQSAQQEPPKPDVQTRKMGKDVGDDFKMEEVEPLPGIDSNIVYELDDASIYQIYDPFQPDGRSSITDVPGLRDYYKAMEEIQSVSSDGPTKSFAYRQLDILEGKFQLYFLVNSYQETADCKKVPHRDFYNVRKVDTHVHHSACMNQKHLLRFIKSKMKKCPHEVVMFRDGKELSLQQVFDSINLTAYDLSIDTLDMHVG